MNSEALRDKLLSHVVKPSGDDGCWEWMLSRNPKGYGSISNDGVGMMRTHRAAYSLFIGEIPEGMYVCHRCDNPPCCNPLHLFLGTPAQNTADMQSKGREPRGERQGNAKITADDVRDIRSMYAAGCKQKQIVNKFGLSYAHVKRIIDRTRWAHVS